MNRLLNIIEQNDKYEIVYLIKFENHLMVSPPTK